MYAFVTKMIGCNLPWVRFKNESQETCQTETDYQAYFKAVNALQSKIRRFRSLFKHCEVGSAVLQKGLQSIYVQVSHCSLLEE